ncbi:MAG: DUF3536 domain-containing protein [Thermodesulfobacteriota bacterium]
MTPRYICIHGHFYQPPRENPWLEAIEVQESAYPYHDWNERVLVECYAPNTASRILNPEGRIVELPNNYARMSFDMGPTLLGWMEREYREVYEAVLSADRMSQKAFSGHGSALAQAYNHMIMPLANRRDKITQVSWGIRDFEHRFGRSPEGMWLPETAVDLETLDIMAEMGVRFTILSPHQARSVRPSGGDSWTDVSGGRIDPTRAYRLSLASGRRINLFFYDGPISHAVAFEHLLSKGEHLLQRLLGGFFDERTWPQLVHIATDGETYGHHQRHGDMALAYAVRQIESENPARLTIYGEFLERHPPAAEVKIFENTSWSCGHGVERWWKDCGCNTGGHPGWNQDWRTPLRESLDWLRNSLAPLFEQQAGRMLKDPWAARDDYIQVILDRSPENVNGFLERHGIRELGEPEKVTALMLLESQRYAMLMYTSCGWFFDEISGIETVQVLQYAARAVRLSEETCGIEIEGPFLDRLEKAGSNIPEHQNGRLIYERFVKPAMIDLKMVGAHYAVSSLFQEYANRDRIFCYRVDREDSRLSESGTAKLALGRVRVTSEITGEAETLSFGAAYFGEHNLSAGVKVADEEADYEVMHREVTGSFASADFPETIRGLDRHFGTSVYSLRSLFRDEQRRVLNQIMESSLEGIRALYRETFNRHVPLMRFLIDLGIPLPEPLACTAGFVLNMSLEQAFEQEVVSSEAVQNLIKEARTLHVRLDAAGLGYTLQKSLERAARTIWENPGDMAALRQLDTAAGWIQDLPFEVNLWKVQNIYYEMLHTALPEWRGRAEHGDEEARDWVAYFIGLGEKLLVSAG